MIWRQKLSQTPFYLLWHFYGPSRTAWLVQCTVRVLGVTPNQVRPSREVIILANWDEIYGQSSRKLGDGDGHQCLARPPRMEQLSSSSSPTLYLIIITLSHSFTPPYWFSVIRGLTDCAVIRLPAALTLMVRLSSQAAAAAPLKGGWGGVIIIKLLSFLSSFDL